MIKPDTYLMQGRRRMLIEKLANNQMIDKKVLDVMSNIPRHNFVPTGLESYAYEDKAVSIASGQTISQPTTVAIQTTLLEPQPNDIVLELGTGSGYQASILSFLVKHVYSVERILELHKSATNLINELGYKNITTIYDDGSTGASEFSPFDKIIITAAIEEIPETLIRQLKVGGIIVAPVGSHTGTQIMQKIIKVSETETKTENHGFFSFVPFKKGKE